MNAILSVYEDNPSLVELMRDAGRIMIYGVIMCLWGAYREVDRSTWPTVGRIKSELAPFGVASDRQIDHLIARLVDLGYVAVGSSENDQRLRLVEPTRLLIGHDQIWLKVHYLPLAQLYGPEAYGPAMALDEQPLFHRDLRAGSLPLLPYIAKDVMRQDTLMMRILNRTVGILALMKMVQLVARHDVAHLSYTDLGTRFGVSRTHIRAIVSDVQPPGEAVSRAPSRLRPPPALLRSFDKLIAEGMAVSDQAYRNALGVRPQPDGPVPLTLFAAGAEAG